MLWYHRGDLGSLRLTVATLPARKLNLHEHIPIESRLRHNDHKAFADGAPCRFIICARTILCPGAGDAQAKIHRGRAAP
jgi:hypothetical protein